MNTANLAKNPKVMAQIVICLAALGLLYYPVFLSLVKDWIHLPDFSHGFLIPFISLYFIWERFKKADAEIVFPSNFGFVVMLAGLMLLFIGNAGAESFSMRISFIVVLSGIILFLLGWKYMNLFIFPILFLIFMIPIPSIILDKITFPMQIFASKVATGALYLLNIPVLREGNIIYLVNTTLEVAEACSGIRSLISLLALGTVFSYFSQKRMLRRLLLVLSCFPIAIIVNAFRVSATGILANYYGTEAAEGFFHGFSGYILFIVAFCLLFGVNAIISHLPYKFKKLND